MKNLFKMGSLAIAGLSLGLLASCSGNGPVPASIQGEMPGAPDGTVIKLCSTVGYPPKILDSTVTKDGKFHLQMKDLFSEPQYCQLTAMAPLTPEQKADEELEAEAYKAFRFFAENAAMTFKCPLDSMQYYYWMPDIKSPKYIPQFTGSESQKVYEAYESKVKPISSQYSLLSNQYYDLLYPEDGQPVQTDKIMELVRQMNEMKPKIRAAKVDFFKAHPESIVTVHEIRNLLSSSATALTKEDIDALRQIPVPELKQTNVWKELEESSQKAYALAKGASYTDGHALDLKGNKVKLSDYIVPGKYNMLEFWASWCGPCRGEIPHLRRVYQLSKGTNFNIISISIDAKDADWQKAVKEENMEWTQLRCGDLSRKEELAKSYHINGVPFSIVLGPDGKIVCGHLRGMQLDYFLEKVLGLDL